MDVCMYVCKSPLEALELDHTVVLFNWTETQYTSVAHLSMGLNEHVQSWCEEIYSMHIYVL